MTLTVYSNSYLIDTMTCSTLTSLRASRQPSRQPSEPSISTRLSPVPEPSPSRIPESIINHDKAIDLMLPRCQQGSPQNNSSDSSSNASRQGQPYGVNLVNTVHPAYPVNPPSDPATLPANPASLPGTPCHSSKPSGQPWQPSGQHTSQPGQRSHLSPHYACWLNLGPMTSCTSMHQNPQT